VANGIVGSARYLSFGCRLRREAELRGPRRGLFFGDGRRPPPRACYGCLNVALVSFAVFRLRAQPFHDFIRGPSRLPPATSSIGRKPSDFIPAVVSGNDVEASGRRTGDAVARARRGEGRAFIAPRLCIKGQLSSRIGSWPAVAYRNHRNRRVFAALPNRPLGWPLHRVRRRNPLRSSRRARLALRAPSGRRIVFRTQRAADQPGARVRSHVSPARDLERLAGQCVRRWRALRYPHAIHDALFKDGSRSQGVFVFGEDVGSRHLRRYPWGFWSRFDVKT